MIGLDTNVLVRYLADDDAVQSRRARDLIENRLTRESPGYVCAITLAELAWVLRRLYAAERTEIATAIEGLLSAVNLTVEHKPLVRQALAEFRDGQADFSDCLIAQINLHAGCEHTLTFDRDAARSTGFKLLSN